MALRVFRLISDLKIAVEVGLVVGTIPQIIPIGSAIVMVPKCRLQTEHHRFFHLYRRYRYIQKQSGFDHFIFDDTHAGFGNYHFREWDSSICSSQSGGAEDFVYLLLSETGIFTLGFFTRSTSALSSATLVTAIMLS